MRATRRIGTVKNLTANNANFSTLQPTCDANRQFLFFPPSSRAVEFPSPQENQNQESQRLIFLASAASASGGTRPRTLPPRRNTSLTSLELK